MNLKHYKKNDPDQMILRDHLAFDRTILAVERTVLAYVKTAFVLFVSAITVFKFFPGDRMLMMLGYLALSATLVVLILGLISFLKSRKRLKQVYKSPQKRE